MSGDIPAYGGFREVRGYGLGRLGTLETGVVAVVVGGLAFSTAISLWAALYGLVIAVPVVAISVVPIGASRRTVAAHTAWWMRAWWGRRSGTDAWVADVFEEVPRGENLPGILAPLVPLDVEDGRGGTQCLIWNRRTGVLSAILMVSPTGMTLSDQGDANSWVAAYGDWLADLGFSPIINSVAFTTESSPSGGVDQRSYVIGPDHTDGAAGRAADHGVRRRPNTFDDSRCRVSGDHQLRLGPCCAGPEVAGGGLHGGRAVDAEMRIRIGGRRDHGDRARVDRAGDPAATPRVRPGDYCMERARRCGCRDAVLAGCRTDPH